MKTGQITVLTDDTRASGTTAPTTSCVDGKGRIWFTDPSTATTAASWRWTSRGSIASTPDGAVDAGARLRRRRASPTASPSTPDDKTLYVIDSHRRTRRQSQDLGLRRAADGTLGHGAWSSTSAKGRGGDGCGSTCRATSGWPPASACRAPPARRPTCRRASTSSSPEGKLLGRIPIPEDLVHQPGLRRAGPQDAVRHGGQDDLQGAGDRLGLCSLSAAATEAKLIRDASRAASSAGASESRSEHSSGGSRGSEITNSLPCSGPSLMLRSCRHAIRPVV